MNYKNTRNFLIMKIDLSSVAGVKALADGASFVKQLNSAKRGFNGRKPSKPSEHKCVSCVKKTYSRTLV